MQVPSCTSKGGFKEVCRFGTTSRGDYICAGNSAGDVRVYDTSTGKEVALVSPIKVRRISLKWSSMRCLFEMLSGLISGYFQVCLTAHVLGQISAPVRACGLSEDCRHLLAILGNGYIFRYEYRKPSSAEGAPAEDSPAEESDED